MITSTDIAYVLACYDLGTPESSRPASHGFVNETAFVTTAHGCFVVRRNHRRFGESALRYRHALITWLHQRSFPTPAIIPTRSGDTLVFLNGRAYEVQNYSEGQDFQAEYPGQLSSIGQTLARYHQCVEGFDPPREIFTPRYLPAGLTSLTARLLERDMMGELHDLLAWYDERAGKLSTILPETAYATLPHLLIHGDIHADNWRFSGDRVTALLDYDQATWDSRLTDLADALVAFATLLDRSFEWGAFQGPLDPSRATQFLNAYTSIAPLTPAEAELLLVLLETLWLRGELLRVISTPEGSPEYHRAVLIQGQQLSAWRTSFEWRFEV